MPKSIYCLCKNRYLVEHLCKCDKQPYYWKHGVGKNRGYVDYEYLLTEDDDRIISQKGNNIIT